MKSGEVGGLLNLGPKSAQWLMLAGIQNEQQLREIGAVAAFMRVREVAPASKNLLWALEGALIGQAWQVVAREHRLRLLLELENLEIAQRREEVL